MLYNSCLSIKHPFFKLTNSKLGKGTSSGLKHQTLKKRLDFELQEPPPLLCRGSFSLYCCCMYVCFLTLNKCISLTADSVYSI